MKKFKKAYDTAATALTVVSYVYCVGVIGKLAYDLCVEAGRNYLKACDCQK